MPVCGGSAGSLSCGLYVGFAGCTPAVRAGACPCRSFLRAQSKGSDPCATATTFAEIRFGLLMRGGDVYEGHGTGSSTSSSSSAASWSCTAIHIRCTAMQVRGQREGGVAGLINPLSVHESQVKVMATMAATSGCDRPEKSSRRPGLRMLIQSAPASRNSTAPSVRWRRPSERTLEPSTHSNLLATEIRRKCARA